MVRHSLWGKAPLEHLGLLTSLVVVEGAVVDRWGSCYGAVKGVVKGAVVYWKS